MAKSDAVAVAARGGVWQEAKRAFRFVLSELKPKGKLLTPFNIVTIVANANVHGQPLVVTEIAVEASIDGHGDCTGSWLIKR